MSLPDLPKIVGALAIVAAAGYALRRWPEQEKEAYTSFSHLALNVKKPQTQWLNMGWWPDVSVSEGEPTEFPDAAQGLASKVLDCLPDFGEEQVHILDLGHGCGDSLLLSRQRFKRATLHGVTSLQAQARAARHRSDGIATVWCLDAIEWLRSREGSSYYDAIIAIDCAYHFSSREDLWRNAFDRLRPGGTVVLFDLFQAFPYPEARTDDFTFDPSPLLKSPSRRPTVVRTLKQSLVYWLSGTPGRNVVHAAAYAELMKDAGFSSIHIRDVSHAVFPGFSRFLKGLGLASESTWRGGSWAQQAGLRSFGEVVDTWASGGDEGYVRCAIVSASKPI